MNEIQGGLKEIERVLEEEGYSEVTEGMIIGNEFKVYSKLEGHTLKVTQIQDSSIYQIITEENIMVGTFNLNLGKVINIGANNGEGCVILWKSNGEDEENWKITNIGVVNSRY